LGTEGWRTLVESCARLTRSLPLTGSDIECYGRCECFIDTGQTAPQHTTQRQNRGASSGWVETWRLSMNYAIGLATRHSTASEATGRRHSIIARTLKTLVECRHPVASLAVLY